VGFRCATIEAHLAEIHGVSVGRDPISRVTDAVMEDVRAWQRRPLEDVCPVIFLDALVLKIREGGTVQRRACYLALGVTVEGDRDVLGMWFQETEGAKFSMRVLTDLRQRGVQDIPICCVDGLKGFPEASEAIFPKTVVPTCVVHLIRHSPKHVPRRERGRVGRDLKPIHNAVDADVAAHELERFDEKYGAAVPGHHPGVAERVGVRDPVSRVSPGGPSGDLHHECDRGLEPAAAESDQDQRTLPQRTGRPKAHLPRRHQRGPAVDPNPELDDSAPGLQDPFRRPPTRLEPTPPRQKVGRPRPGPAAKACKRAAGPGQVWTYELAHQLVGFSGV
jgi:Transposase, Mutator family